MPSASRLYKSLFLLLSQSKEWADIRHLYTLIWMIIGLIHAETVSLTKWGAYLKSRAVFAQSKQRRFSRWLHNPRINVQRLYSPLIKLALASWEAQELHLSLDTSLLWNQYCLIRVALVYRGRAIPIVWRVIEHSSSSVKISCYQDLLKRAKTLMPGSVKIILLRGSLRDRLVI